VFNPLNLSSYAGFLVRVDRWNRFATTNGMKIFVGLPAGPKAAGSGYVPDTNLNVLISGLQNHNTTSFGGIMLW